LLGRVTSACQPDGDLQRRPICINLLDEVCYLLSTLWRRMSREMADFVEEVVSNLRLISPAIRTPLIASR
jgi:hypothetical protein